MIHKLGKGNTLPGEERKREKPHHAYLAAAFLLLYIAGSIFAFSVLNTEWASNDIPKIIFCVFAGVIPAGVFISYVDSDKYERHIEFKIHKYDRWIHSESKYKTFYITEGVTLNSKFVFHKHVFDYKEEMSQKEVEESCKKMASSHYDDFFGHNSQEEAMASIFRQVNSIIKSEKTKQKIKIKNVSTLETFTYEDLKEKLLASSIEDIENDLKNNGDQE